MQTPHYDLRLVLASLLISLLAAWVALDLSGRIHLQKSRRRRNVWLGAGSMAMGIGIWSMHYVGMLAYRMSMPVLYYWPTVAVSMVAGVVASGIALSAVSRKTMSWISTLVGGLSMGGGIASMHYIGMAAMRMQGTVSYSWPMVILSVAAAICISMAGLRLTFGTKTIGQAWSRRKAASAVLIGLAIPTMHYIGMAAAQWSPGPSNSSLAELRHAVSVSDFSTLGIVLVTLLVLSVALISAGVDRHVFRFESALDGSRRGYVQLKNHNARLQAAFRAAGVGVWECDPATGLFYVDASLRNLYSVEQDNEPVPRALWRTKVHGEDLVDLDRKWSECLASGDKYENEYRIIQPNGELRTVRSVASIIRSESGAAERVLGMTWDVTAERAREKQTAELAERFRLTLEAIGDAVIATDEHRRVMYLNRVASQLTGWTSDECLGKALADVFVTINDRTGTLRGDPVQRCIESGGSLLAEDGVLVSRSGTRHNIRKHVALMDQSSAAVLTFQDITEARRMEQELVHAATHDVLTGLANRATLEKKLSMLWEGNRYTGRTHCLCILDLDRFKIINDTSGHLAGDAFLRVIAGVLEAELRPYDVAARMGGDEFMVLMVDTDEKGATAEMERLLRTISALRFPWNGRVYDVTASVGLVLFDCFSPGPEVLLSQADVAVFTAKRDGRNRVSAYCHADGVVAVHHQEMEVVADLRNSIERGCFELYAQPIVPSSSVSGARYFELLLRMRDDAGRLIPPGDFIPAVERYGLMADLDRWVIRHAFESYRHHLHEKAELCFAINLSAASLSDPTLWEFVSGEFSRTNVPPNRITFEVTETGVIHHLEHARSFMLKARLAGSRIALDDFGTGLSSLSYLKQFPLDIIKVDGAFIRHLDGNALDQAIVRSIAEIARAMEAATVAECVEDISTVAQLERLGIDYVQGWAIGRPGPLIDVLHSATEQSQCHDVPEKSFLVAEAAV